MEGMWQITWFSLWVALLGTAVILPPGIALGWWLARAKVPGKALVETFVALPLVVPPVATGLILLKLLGRRGPLGRLWETLFGSDIVFTWRAVVIATAVMAFPLLVRTVKLAFEQVNPRLEQVARTLGASEGRVFWAVTLPLARNGIVAGLLLSFARALGEFGATMMVAGYIPERTGTLSLSIYHAVQLGRDDEALAYLVISVALAFSAVWLSEVWLRKAVR